MRLALVGPMPPPEGGMANQCRQLARLLAAEGVDVEIVRTNAPHRPQWLGRIRFVREPARLIPYLFALWRAVSRADVVHVFANSGLAWHLIAAPAIAVCRMQGKPVIINYRGGGAQEFLAGAPRWVVRQMHAADALIVPSGFLQKVFTDVGLAPRIIPNIVDLARFHPAAGERPARAPHIVVTRNLEKIYDVASAIRALAALRAHLPDARMTIAGAGPEREALVALIASLGLGGAVELCGRLGNDAIAELYRSADVMLNPSLVDNMPVSVLEAFASGVPVVSTNVGGVPYIAQHESTALLVPPADPAACADALRRVLTDRGLASRLVENARVQAAGYSWERVRSLWLSEYDAHASSRHQSPTTASKDAGSNGSSPPPG